MDALRANYGSDSEDSEDSPTASQKTSLALSSSANPRDRSRLPPPPVDLLQPQNALDFSTSQGNRIRSFAHVEGNYALHVFIPVRIPSTTRKQLASSMNKNLPLALDLYVVDVDITLRELHNDSKQFEQVLFGRDFHISLGRTVPIKVHQIVSIVSMLRQRFQLERRYWMEFNKWDVFINDEHTRSFLSLEITGGGLSEISKQICMVNEVYRLHGLPEFYKNPRPHISVVWAPGDANYLLKPAAEELNRSWSCANLPGGCIFTSKLTSIECKIGKKLHTICKLHDQ
ncbi:hypothetical protein AXF42_Ash010039 [Apostasia shenzhenica]|uniref:U6 snRNA phosphodiesterase n=1 Tax=Apostasia shenzhenica TaxID=1088818 RepID=A0A2I0ACQ1_9ASPA|nr:hypothetical protein AXF42_Ash010039 [Apostasia shenzhenica]